MFKKICYVVIKKENYFLFKYKYIILIYMHLRNDYLSQGQGLLGIWHTHRCSIKRSQSVEPWTHTILCPWTTFWSQTTWLESKFCHLLVTIWPWEIYMASLRLTLLLCRIIILSWLCLSNPCLRGHIAWISFVGGIIWSITNIYRYMIFSYINIESYITQSPSVQLCLHSGKTLHNNHFILLKALPYFIL